VGVATRLGEWGWSLDWGVVTRLGSGH